MKNEHASIMTTAMIHARRWAAPIKTHQDMNGGG